MAEIYISLGSNVDREYHVKSGLEAIADAFNIPFKSLKLSSLFESESIGFIGKPFYNMVVGFNCEQNLDQVATLLRDIEYNFGRNVDAKKFSPRTLDLDLLIFDDVITDFPAQLPRDEIKTNAFVLWPLSEVAPNVIHPTLNKSFQSLWQDYDKTKQQLAIVANCW
jgi:2-amino-4-hydroxy-6-hydroxymethyldihydropteridine diphosphokinase